MPIDNTYINNRTTINTHNNPTSSGVVGARLLQARVPVRSSG